MAIFQWPCTEECDSVDCIRDGIIEGESVKVMYKSGR